MDFLKLLFRSLALLPSLIQGIETLVLRMREHSRNGRAVADFLAARKEAAVAGAKA